MCHCGHGRPCRNSLKANFTPCPLKRRISGALLVSLLSQLAGATAPDEDAFTLGIIGPFSSISQTLLAGAVAFDLDFRKNTEPDLVSRFGPPVVQVPDLHPDLRIQTVIGTSDSKAEIGVKLALDWMLGTPPFPQVDGIVGGFHSAISGPIASNSAVFTVPQVSWGSTSPSLSNKLLYPYFSRVLPPDGLAIWTWIDYFGVPSVSFFYGDEAYGRGLYQVTYDAAAAVNAAHRLNAVPIDYMPVPEDFNISKAQIALASVRATGSRFIVIGMGYSEALSALYVMELEGMLYTGSYQILASESVDYIEPLQRPYTPSMGLPVGFQKFSPKTVGRLYPTFEQLWGLMTPEDVYGSEARERYMLNDWKVTVENATAPMLTAADFAPTLDAVGGLGSMVSFIFDASYTFVFALNQLLNDGMTLREVNGSSLLSHIRSTSFEGVSGNVSYSSEGDRHTNHELWNAQSNGSRTILVHVGDYVSSTDIVILHRSLVWVTGESSYPPAALHECPFGFEKDVTTNVCVVCSPGVGCGYNAETGFPIGIFGPFTSLDQDLLGSAVLFDLDFRKNFDASVRQNFGPPIVTIPNLNPELRIQTILGTSDSKVNIGMETTLNWFLGIGDFPKVAGIVGGYHSAIAGPVASNAQVFEVPQISWGATSPSLSDKTLYPWFVRTIPPDSLQGSAFWAWMHKFNIPSAAYLYTRESYGEGLFQTTADLATAAGQPGRISGIGIAVMNEESYDLNVALEACDKILSTGSRFIMMAFTTPSQATSAMYAMEQKEMLYGAYQLLGAEGIVLIHEASFVPTNGLPLGFQKFEPVSRGALYERYMDMWRKMTPEDVYGVDAQRRYMIDRFLVKPSEANVDMLTQEDFTTNIPWVLSPFVVDAAYTFVVAINNLLNAGIPGKDIHGGILLEAAQNTTFQGITGTVQYDENSDRVGDYELKNLQDGPQGYEEVVAAVWSAGTEEFTFSSLDKTITWAGGIISASAPDELVACAPGQRWDGNAGLCIFCPLNWFSMGGVAEAAVCSACVAGKISTSPLGATGCQNCSNGTFRDIGDDTCRACPAGAFGENEGQSECHDCPIGEYSSTAGQSACNVCGAGRASVDLFTTMKGVEVNGQVRYSYLVATQSASNCGCDVGTREDGSGECVQCTEGMICKGLNDVHVEEGYYAEPITASGDLSIFKCHGDWLRCAGGLPGQTCAVGRTGITCSECLDGMTPSTGGTCVECGGSDQGPFIVVVIAGTLSMIVIYHFVDTQNRATQSHALLLCAIAVGQLVAVTQQLGVVGMLSVDWEEPIKSFMQLLSVLTFNLEVLRMNCVSSQGPVERFAMKVFIILVSITMMIVIHCGFVLGRHHGQFRQRVHTLVGCVGTLFMVFYISVTTTVLEPLQCQLHPNGEWTIRSYPSIICWDTDEHVTMLILGSIAFLLVPVAFLVGCVIVVRQFPRRMRAGDAEFLKAFSFLFFRFKPSRNAFVLVQMVRSFSIALVLVIPDQVSQIFTLEGILLIAFSATIYYLPWRVSQANLLDCLFGGCTLVLICLASLFLKEADKDLSTIAWLAFSFLLIILALVPLAILYGLFRKYGRTRKPYQFFLCHHKNGAGAYVRLLKLHLMDSPKLLASVFVDSDNLDNLDRLFDYVGNDTKCLTVILSEEIFTRPWCVGEMCTARLKKVQVVMIALPSYTLPDDEFIEELANRICNIEVLTENGISLACVAETMPWMCSQPMMKVPPLATPPILNTMVDRLINDKIADIDEFSKNDSCQSPKGSMASRKTVMVYDLSNLEAAATAHVLKKMLIGLLSHDTDKIPEILDSSDLNLLANTILFICTNGLFENQDIMQVLLQVPKTTAQLLPVISEQVFRFPAKDLNLQLVRVLPPGLNQDDANVIASVVVSIFKEIAISFVAQHAGESNLRLAAEDVSRRLLNGKGGTVKSTKSLAAAVSPKNSSPTKPPPTVMGVSSKKDGEQLLANKNPELPPSTWDLDL